MRLDRNSHFGQVFGMDGVAFEQNGRYFNPAGREVTADGAPVPEAAQEAPQIRNTEAEQRALKAIYGDDA